MKYKNRLKMQSHTVFKHGQCTKLNQLSRRGDLIKFDCCFDCCLRLFHSANSQHGYCSRATKTSVCTCSSHFNKRLSILTEEVMNVGVMILMAIAL